ncbi:MAG: hypothetical protein A3H27_18560 [Acidobacteria bacterium RIFCSPLOWO2_02_FULL_59_13]|nr:MAG: hypothetical protein A3H27_18560 [Acidobacteria bacterium RIFCSPLOWO2_02_FULL_59_13]
MAGRSEAAASLKHDLRRGEIIWILKQDYPHLVTFRHLQLALRDRNIPLSPKDLEIYLSYLEERGFVRCPRRFDEDESRKLIVGAAMTARGILLLDGKISDAGVRF